jgi:hypothetical protein
VATGWWSDDGHLLAALDDALRSADEVPPSFVEAGRACYTWHHALSDARIAALTYDSESGARECLAALAHARSSELRALTFDSPRLSLHLEVTRGTLHGQLVPPQPGEVELCPLDGPECSTPVDEVGWFVVRPLPTGSVRLRCRTRDGSMVLTDWFTV